MPFCHCIIGGNLACWESTASLQSAVTIPRWSQFLIKLLKPSTGRIDPLPHRLKKWWLAPFLPKILWFTSLAESFHAKFTQRDGLWNFQCRGSIQPLCFLGRFDPFVTFKIKCVFEVVTDFLPSLVVVEMKVFPEKYKVFKAPMERISARWG